MEKVQVVFGKREQRPTMKKRVRPKKKKIVKAKEKREL
jgi:hypothetical protein